MRRTTIRSVVCGAKPVAMGAFVLALVAVASCEREAREPRVQPPAARRVETIPVTDLRPGPVAAASTQGAATQPAPRPPAGPVENEFEQNAYHLAEGKRLYSFFNCNGCHANGGGGMGPPFIDDEWIYGHRSEQIFASIVQGRPDGMPTFQGRIPDYQVWQLTAYLRSLGGLVDSDVAPGRGDSISGPPVEHSMPRQQPPAKEYDATSVQGGQ